MKQPKPILKVDRKRFIDWILDENGLTEHDLGKTIKRKGSVSAEDLMKQAGYLPSELLRNKTRVPDELKDNRSEIDGDFEVYPEDFTVVFIG